MYQQSEDIKHPILNDILQSQREIRWLCNRGRYWKALKHFRVMASGLYFFAPTFYVRLDKIVEDINQLEKDASRITGLTRELRINNYRQFLNRNAERLYPKINREIALILIEAGFVQAPDKDGRFDLKPPALTHKSGRRKVAREGLKISSSRAGEHKKEM